MEFPERERWRDAHEIVHVGCPWHCLRADHIYVEDDKTLGPKARRWFEVEANYGAGQLIFPPACWVPDANDGDCSFESIIALAQRYAASKRATFRHFVEVQQRACVGLSYLPHDRGPREEDGRYRLHKPKMFCSHGFERSHPQWTPPLQALTCWRQAMLDDELTSGEDSDSHPNAPTVFRWHAFWNSFELMVLLSPVKWF